MESFSHGGTQKSRWYDYGTDDEMLICGIKQIIPKKLMFASLPYLRVHTVHLFNNLYSIS
jgi:hypothetical protein